MLTDRDAAILQAIPTPRAAREVASAVLDVPVEDAFKHDGFMPICDNLRRLAGRGFLRYPASNGPLTTYVITDAGRAALHASGRMMISK